MSSSSPLDNWDLLLSSTPSVVSSNQDPSLGTSRSPGLLSVSPAASQSSGEFNQFVSIGSAISGGEVENFFRLFMEVAVVESAWGS